MLVVHDAARIRAVASAHRAWTAVDDTATGMPPERTTRPRGRGTRSDRRVEGEAVDLTGQIQGFHPIGIARLTALAEAAGLSDPAPFFQALDFQGFLLQRRA